VRREESTRAETRIENRYAILGAVAKPGNFVYEKTTVRLALELAGGLLKTADRGRIAVRRGFLTDPVNSQSMMFDYRKVLDGKAPDMELLPGDVIEVPAGSPKRGFFDKLLGGAKKLIAPALPF